MELLIFFSSKNSFFYLSKISLNRIKVFNRKLTFYFWSPTNRNYKTFFVSKKTHTRQRPSFSEISKKSKKQSKTVVRKRIIFFWERRVEKKNKSWRNNFFLLFPTRIHRHESIMHIHARLLINQTIPLRSAK